MYKLTDNTIGTITGRLVRLDRNGRLWLPTILLGALLVLELFFAAGVGAVSAAETDGDTCDFLLREGAEETIPNKYLLAPGIRRELQKGLEAVFAVNAAYEQQLKTTTLLSDGKIGRVTKGWLKRFCEDFPVYGTAAEVPDAVARSALHYAEIAAKHPDWKQTVASPEFDAWISQRPTDGGINRRQLRRSGAAPVVIRLLDDFAVDQAAEGEKAAVRTDEASCKGLLKTGKDNQISRQYLKNTTNGRSLQRNVQEGLQTIFADNSEFESELERTTELSDGRIGPVTRKWLERFCIEYPVSGLADSVPDQVVQSALHYAEMAAVHSNWKSVVTDSGFNDWIREPVPEGEPGNRPYRLSGSAPIVIELINEYFDDSPPPLPRSSPCLPVTDKNAAVFYELTAEDLKRLKDRAGFLKQVEKLEGKRFGTDKELQEAIGPTVDLLHAECVRARFLQIIDENRGMPKVSFRLTKNSFRALRTNLKLPTGIEGHLNFLFREKLLTALKEREDDDFPTKDELARAVSLIIKALLEAEDPGAQDPRNAPQAEPARRKTDTLINTVVEQVVAAAEKVSPYKITAETMRALNEDPLFVAFPKDVLSRLQPLLGVAFPNRRIYATAVESVLTSKSTRETKIHAPAPAAVGTAQYVNAVTIQARKEGQGKPPLRLKAEDCGCARTWDTVGENRLVVYGFYPFWLSEGAIDKVSPATGDGPSGQTDGGPTVDFSVLNRIGYFALELDAQGGIENLRLWTEDDGAADFLAKAHKYYTKVDLVIEARNWQSWNNEAIQRAARGISSLLDPERTPAAMIPDGIALYFPALQRYPTQKSSIVALVSKLHDWLDKRKRADAVSLNIILDGSVRDLDVQIEPLGENNLMGGLEGLLHNQEDPKMPAMVDLVLVFLDHPVSETKKQLRLAVENEISDNARVDVLRKILPIIPPNGHGRATSKQSECGGANDQFWQLQADLVYFRDNFRGVAFWPIPHGGHQEQTVLKQRLDCTFAKSQALNPAAKALMAVFPDICSLVCPNRLVLQVAFLGLFGLMILLILLAFWNCWVRSTVRKRFLYPLLAVALLILLGMALVSCDPRLNEYEIWILSVLVAILALAWLYYYIRKVKQGELP